MRAFLPTLLHAFRALVLCVVALCFLAQPVLSAAHEVHAAAHAGADSSQDVEPEPGSFHQLVHDYHVCLNLTGIPAEAMTWHVPARAMAPSRPIARQRAPSPLGTLLRPPIAA
jgi:hypothetical protein